MNTGKSSNGNASATPLPSERSSYGNLTEGEFLTHEMELAKTAISGALAELRGDLSKAGDVRLWAHHYPWLSVGMAAVTGFTLAAIVKKGDSAAAGITAEEEHDRQRLLRETAKAPYNSKLADGRPKLGDSLLGSLFSLARTALEASLISAIRAEGIERVHAGAAGSASSTRPAAGPNSAVETPAVSEPLSSAAL